MSATIACIGGTAAHELLLNKAFPAERMGPRSTPFGDSQPIYACRAGEIDFFFLLRHGESGFDLVPGSINYRANIYALKDLGVRDVVSWSETRALNHNYKVGQYAVVSDLIDETRSRATTFFEAQALGDGRQWPVFCPDLTTAMADTLSDESCAHARSGVYVCIEGPRRETPAEAGKYARLGGELLGHTLAPEVFLAKELELCYASLCFVASYAETGSDFHPFEHGRIIDPAQQQARAAAAIERFPRILTSLFARLQHATCTCSCGESMRRNVEAGRIDRDWRTWFENGSAIHERADVDVRIPRLFQSTAHYAAHGS